MYASGVDRLFGGYSYGLSADRGLGEVGDGLMAVDVGPDSSARRAGFQL